MNHERSPRSVGGTEATIKSSSAISTTTPQSRRDHAAKRQTLTLQSKSSPPTKEPLLPSTKVSTPLRLYGLDSSASSKQNNPASSTRSETPLVGATSIKCASKMSAGGVCGGVKDFLSIVAQLDASHNSGQAKRKRVEAINTKQAALPNSVEAAFPDAVTARTSSQHATKMFKRFPLSLIPHKMRQ